MQVIAVLDAKRLQSLKLHISMSDSGLAYKDCFSVHSGWHGEATVATVQTMIIFLFDVCSKSSGD